MNHLDQYQLDLSRYNTRRQFLRKCITGLGGIALASLAGCGNETLFPGNILNMPGSEPLAATPSHFAPRAKRVIFLHMEGAPSQLELFDYKPTLHKLDGQPCPPSLLEGKRFAFLKGVPNLLGPQARFEQYGQSRTWVSEFLPHFSQWVDEVSILKAMHTDEFNHAPAQFYMHTGSPRVGRPSMGSWVAYGLGAENENLPAFVVLLSGPIDVSAGKSIWGSGFLPTVYQGVQCHSVGDPVANIANPRGVSSDLRQKTITAINQINQREYEEVGDPEILSRISQYELAFRMQTSVPETMNIDDEPAYIHEMYGTEPGKKSFANNCLLARKLVEKGVRFVQLFDRRWDHHGTGKGNGVNDGLKNACEVTDKPVAALLTDLKQRGLLDETLVIWGGEFGRTPMMETRASADYRGRDHHTDAFTMWMAGGGIRKGFSFGETDEIGFSGIKDRVHIHDLQATILHCLGLDHERLTYPFQGRNFRLTDVHGKVVREVLG
ncbi:MAG: DUF1501 domain-containing protein [Bacteroidia bacterium]|nr:DUF1501 domain-containing protein [Bacteroidia bacterium]